MNARDDEPRVEHGVHVDECKLRGCGDAHFVEGDFAMFRSLLFIAVVLTKPMQAVELRDERSQKEKRIKVGMRKI